MIRTLKKIGKILLLVLFAVVGLFFTLILVFNIVRWRDISLQKQHLKDLRDLYSEDFVPIDEQKFVGFDLEDNDLRLNEIRILASHNSYKKKGTAIGKLFVGLGDSFAEARALEYGNPDLTTQLNVGIRSFELDVRYRKDEFECTHVPLVDNSTTAAKLALAFEEIALWSKNNPNHIPIILLLELKSDWMMLDPLLEDIGSAELTLLDELIVASFSDSLYTPKELMGAYSSIRERLVAESWPLVNALLGKVIVVLHPGKFTSDYLELDPEFDDMAMFPAVSNQDIDHPHAAFSVHNNPDPERILPLLEANMIVRTRMDSSLIPNEEVRALARECGAQIMTTDFHPAHQFKNKEKVFLEAEYLIIRNDAWLDDDD
ncbi:MAG: Ca2+-dependent phosphoinositide-specific phospholipase C [Candidatus Izemoplasmatales bacterium]|jgi:hypothetical protein